MDNINKINMDDYKPLRDLVFENLREAILKGDLNPGDRLMEVQLANKLGVSRTPVREAIRKLELEGLVIMLPRKGAYVADMSLKDIIEVLEIRASLEGLAAYLASERMGDEDIKKLEEIVDECSKTTDIEELLKKDVEFHEQIFKSTNNKRLHQLINSLWEQVYRFRVSYVSDNNSFSNIVKEHKMIMNAIKNRDGELAKKYAKEHIEKAESFVIDRKTKNN